MVARVGPRTLVLDELHRFAHAPLDLVDGLHWDITGLYREVLTGLEQLPRGVATFGVDSWAVDYALLDGRGALLGVPFSYRDGRTSRVLDEVHLRLPPEQLYALNGLQFLPFTTIYQLAAARLDGARTLLLLPDLLGYWLTGQVGAEITNASTTGLLDVRTRTWSPELCAAAGVASMLLPPLREPGDELGTVRSAVREHTRFDGMVRAVGSHDTASAVVAVPMRSDRAAYVSLGTWALAGVELDKPVLTEESRAANFTNELGVDGRVRFLRNVTGLFLLTEVLHHWRSTALDRDRLLAAAMELGPGPVFDVDDPRLATPGDMVRKVQDVVQDIGWPSPRRKAAVVRAILDSLAVKLAGTVDEAARLSGVRVEIVHVVGGGARNHELCQLLADAVGLPVVAGPVEATALGNALVQARAHGTVRGDLEALRALVGATQPLRRFSPRA
jgi:sugar (pentulose or hexulose) kinase